MTTSKTNEQAFEALIEKALVGSTIEERKDAKQTDVDAQTPSASQYYWGKPSDFDKKTAIDQRRLWSFLESTQQAVLDKYVGKDLKASVEKQIDTDIKTFGIIQVLRKGIDLNNIHLSFPTTQGEIHGEGNRKEYRCGK